MLGHGRAWACSLAALSTSRWLLATSCPPLPGPVSWAQPRTGAALHRTTGLQLGGSGGARDRNKRVEDGWQDWA